MRIAILGSEGQLAADLLLVLKDHELVPLSHRDLDIAHSEAVNRVLDSINPACVINTAAYNLVDKAEGEWRAVFATNADGPKHIAQWCEQAGASVVHFSTDYVFSGTNLHGIAMPAHRGHTESSVEDPRGVYAISKLAGEKNVQRLCDRHFVFRTCGLYGRRQGTKKGNFVQGIIRAARERQITGQPLRVVDDHRCTPTSTEDLAKAVAQVIKTNAYGLYHATNSGDTTWRRFAEEILRICHIPVSVEPITAAEYGAKAQRPSYSVLDCGKVTQVLKAPLAPWQNALQRYLATLAGGE